MHLGQFPHNGDLPVTQHPVQIPNGVAKLMRRLIKNHGALLVLKLLQVVPAGFFIDGQKALKGKAPALHTGHRQRCGKSHRSGHGHHRDPLQVAQVHQILPRVRNGRHTRVRYNGAVLPRRNAGSDDLAPLPTVVLIIADHLFFDTKMIQQL